MTTREDMYIDGKTGTVATTQAEGNSHRSGRSAREETHGVPVTWVIH